MSKGASPLILWACIYIKSSFWHDLEDFIKVLKSISISGREFVNVKSYINFKLIARKRSLTMKWGPKSLIRLHEKPF